VVVHPGAVAILCRDAQDRIAVIRQYRSTVDRDTFEIPAGTCDVIGEEPLLTAQRELREEVGVEASSWRFLGTFMNSPGWTDQVIHIFEARSLTFVDKDLHGPEEEYSQILWLSIDEVRGLQKTEVAFDSTFAVSLLAVYGGFFNED
jgi:ADP-ribose pyrophosphatase